MNTHSAKEFIANSPFFEWFKNQEISLNLPYLNYDRKFKGVGTFHDFLNRQLDKWGKIKTSIPDDLKRSYNFFDRLLQSVDQLLDHNIESEARLDYLWRQINEFIQNNVRRELPLVFELPESEFLLKLYKSYPDYFQGAFKYFTSDARGVLDHKSSAIGFLMAYEFANKDKSEIVSRRQAEKKSLSQLKEEFAEYINTSELHLINYINSTKRTFDKVNQQILEEKDHNSKEYSEWFAKVSNEQLEFFNDSSKKVSELATTYEELLRLEKPATYWAKRASVLKKEGWIALSIASILLVFSAVALYMLLWQTPEGMLKSFFGGDAHSAIRWSIIFITFISFMFFGIQKLMKVTFSSFHLARDAEEREQLTHVYLAMINDSKIDIEDRHLVLQSLFSRADTGLLKDDGGPTMPGGIMEKLNK